ncbi:hypothetical protein ASPFODRAFT_62704 [Aspergillus luchuensis CBS 106.47]|uniref:Uncharacterized protein n=1 Tax=Aspergillus luchuensis (strain CBS 106.47) TaxID=1137211 RepID=A0A1M3TDN1_ASPLC|nr:hypothetical protein ASPFODRAFT_62704 [Aspergillus luchuensis CBS 106.47]
MVHALAVKHRLVACYLIWFPKLEIAAPTREQLQESMDHGCLEALTESQRRLLAAITWGITALHYSNHHSISIHPASVFEELVVRCHDGYCMENTNLFYMVLWFLGYQVYATGSRVSRTVVSGDPTKESYISLSNMLLIVTIAGQKYMNTTAPLITPSQMSLIKALLADFMDQTQKVWIYQARSDSQSPWVPQYSYDKPFYFTSKSRAMLFTQTLACTRVILDDHNSAPIGIYIFLGERSRGYFVGRPKSCEPSIRRRIESALVEYFDMHFHAHEIEGTRGIPSQIECR